MEIKTLLELISHTCKSHNNFPVKPGKAFRKWDGQTPYSVHPILCSMMILTETKLPEELRFKGSQALLLHDVLEDTTAELPNDLDPEVIWMVNEMTFTSSQEEIKKIWKKDGVIKLLKLYDKVSNLLDGSWMSENKSSAYKKYTGRLCKEVEKIYGKLNIVKIAETLVTD